MIFSRDSGYIHKHIDPVKKRADMVDEQLDTFGVVESTEVASMSPGVHLSASTAGQTKQFTIRGVTQNDFSSHAEAPNAVYIDEGYIASPQAQLFASFDLERVEVLKGPQGTLFGRNATGGLVHYITRKPSQELDGYASLTYGDYEQVKAEGAIGGGLTEKISARLSGVYNEYDGVYELATGWCRATPPTIWRSCATARSGSCSRPSSCCRSSPSWTTPRCRRCTPGTAAPRSAVP